MNRAQAIPAVALRGITKSFPGVVANRSVDLDLYWGEIHCLLGENGAGKSTLVQVLSGMCPPDSGSITVAGQPIGVGSPKDALAHGVGTVYQHPIAVPTFTVLENLLLGMKGRLRLGRQSALRSLAELAGRIKADLDPYAIVGDLTFGRQKQVEIIKALWSGSKILVLDEPTSMLTPREVEDLQQLLVALRNEGLAVLFITHKLREALAVGDRITILRQGEVVGSLTPGRIRSMEMGDLETIAVTMLFGDRVITAEEAAELGRRGSSPRAPRPLSPKVVLRADDISVNPGPWEVGVREVSLAVRYGEILGVAGVDGNGQRELAEALAGQRSVAHGRIWLEGEDVTHAGVAHRQRLGLRFITDDRMGEGMVSSLPLSLNLLLKRIGEQPFWTRTGRISRAVLEGTAQKLADEFDIRAPSVRTRVDALSGGNIQKMLLARELSFDPKVIIYNNPTHGLDLKATLAVHRRIREMSTLNDVAAVLMSADLDELMGLCDRIAVIFKGRLAGIVENSGLGVEEKVGALMLGAGG